MKIFKAGLFSSASTALQMLASLILYKVVAVKLGPLYIGQLGQFITFLSIILIVSNAGINNGLVKMISENRANDAELKKVFGTAYVIVFFSSSILLVLSFFIFESIFKNILFFEKIDNTFFYIFLVSILFITTTQFILSIVNGFKRTEIYAISVSIGSIVSICFSILLIYNFGIWGAFYTLLINYFVQGTFLLYIIIMKLKISNLFIFNLDVKVLKNYLNYSIMFIFSAIAIPMAQIIVRHFVESFYTLDDVGYWETLFRLSSIYITFIGVFFNIYYLPHLANKNDKQIITEVKKVFILLTLGLLSIFSLIYFLKEIIISLLFSSEFLIVSKYIYIQQIGDFFRILSLSIGYVIVVKMWTKIYLLFEFIHFILLILLSYIFLKITNGFYGASIAYALTYFSLFLINLYILNRFIKRSLK